MQALLTRTRYKARYYLKGLPPHQALLRILIDVLAQLGLRIEPFYLTVENLSKGLAPRQEEIETYEMGLLQPSDMPFLAAMPGRSPTEAELRQRLDDGKRCWGIRQHGEIVAFTWVDFEAVRFEDYPLFRLQANEAYLFDTYTGEKARGSGHASLLRHLLYDELAKSGRNRIYSITVLFNKPASRMKAKWGARVIELHLLAVLCKRWRFHRVLRHYEHPQM